MPERPETGRPQAAPRGSGLQLVVTFMDDAQRFFPLRGVPGAYDGWTIKREHGVALLIIGAAPPRVEVPLANVRFLEVQPFRTHDDELVDAVLGDFGFIKMETGRG